jgi:hypothetical protein
LWEPTRELRGSLTASSQFFSWTLLAWQPRLLMARMQPTAFLTFCGRCATPRLWLVVALTRLSARRTLTTERRSVLKNALRRCPNNTLLWPEILTRSPTTHNVAKWGRLKPSS